MWRIIKDPTDRDKKMSWFSYAKPVAKIHPRNHYYFLTSERSEQGYFRLYSADNITLISTEIKRLPPSSPGKKVVVMAVPRSFIDTLNPSKDFVIKLRITCGKKKEQIHNFDSAPLEEFLNLYTFGYPECLCHALISAGKPSLDLEDRLTVISRNLTLPKFKDDKILEKLTATMHDAIHSVNRTAWPEFSFDNGAEDESKVTVKVMVSLNPKIKEKFTSEEVGVFITPEHLRVEPETDAPSEKR